MFVIEDGSDAVVLPENIDDLLEELVARILLLPDVVHRIVAVFTDQ